MLPFQLNKELLLSFGGLQVITCCNVSQGYRLCGGGEITWLHTFEKKLHAAPTLHWFVIALIARC